MDAAALGGWTARGTAKVLMDRLQGMPADSRPGWMDGLSSQKLEELLTKVIVDAVEASQVVQEYMDTEREKGRDFDDIYADVKPYLDRVSRPIEEDMKDGTLDTKAEELLGVAQQELGSKAAAKDRRQQRAPHRNLGASRQASSASPELSKGILSGAPFDYMRRSSAAESLLRRGRPGPDTLRSMDLGEPLVLVGCCNGWRVDEARRLHRFQRIEGTAAGVHMSHVRVKVPKAGLRFIILSAEKEWQWRLIPAKKGTVHRGEKNAQPAALAMGPDADEKARGKDFKVKGERGYGVVDVHVSLDLERGAHVWLIEVTDEAGLQAIAYPGME